MTIMNSMRVIWGTALIIAVGLVGVGLWAWPPHPGNNRCSQGYRVDPIDRILYEFYKPRQAGPTPYCYIWMPKGCFSAHGKISVLVEFHLDVKSDFPYFSIDLEGPSEEIRTGEGRRLLVKRDGWVVGLRRSNLPRLKVSDFLPPLDSIPTHWLHGNPVEPERMEGEFGPWGEITLHPGESSVMRIPNLIDYFNTKRGEYGRLFVEVYDYRSNRAKWLPIEGRYRVQYSRSNIIEFNIR